MSAEEFTDTVFAKIDINGDGEGTRGRGGGVGSAGEGSAGMEVIPSQERTEALCWSPCHPPLPGLQN